MGKRAGRKFFRPERSPTRTLGRLRGPTQLRGVGAEGGLGLGLESGGRVEDLALLFGVGLGWGHFLTSGLRLSGRRREGGA